VQKQKERKNGIVGAGKEAKHEKKVFEINFVFQLACIGSIY